MATESVSAAMLSVLGKRNRFIGYIGVGSVLGLVEVLDGSGQLLRAMSARSRMRSEAVCSHMS